MMKGLRMGHKAKNMAVRVSQTRYAQRRAIGIMGIGFRSFSSSRINIAQGDEVFRAQTLQTLRAGCDSSFAMSHRQIKGGQIFRENAGRIRIYRQTHPAILKFSGAVRGKGNLPREIQAIQARKHAYFDEQLKAIANAQNQAALRQKHAQEIKQRDALPGFHETPAAGGGLCGSQIIAIQKAARKDQELVIQKIALAIGYLKKMRQIDNIRSGQSGCMGRLQMGVGSITSYYKSFYHAQRISPEPAALCPGMAPQIYMRIVWLADAW